MEKKKKEKTDAFLVTFTKDEKMLYQAINKRCEHESKAGFAKKAMAEKLERENLYSPMNLLIHDFIKEEN